MSKESGQAEYEGGWFGLQMAPPQVRNEAGTDSVISNDRSFR